MGDSIATNLFMVGYAYQRGLIPVSEAAIRKAIELNGAAIESNTMSFQWGLLAAVDPAKVAHAAIPGEAVPESQRLSESLAEMVERRVKFLTDYQHAAYAKRYSDLVAKVRDAEARAMPGITELAEAVARYYFKLLAIKDEYEVARLYAETDFEERVAAAFEGDYKLTFNLAPPIFNKPDPVTGVPKKTVYGPWMMKAFRLLAKMRKYRGTALDIFGGSDERRMERQLVKDYEAVVDEILSKLTPQNHATAVELASVPEHIRGYGHVKEAHLKTAKTREAALLAAFRAPAPAAKPAVVKVVV
jgi:indolepyruvate ferredoxin oxidoreductase